MGPIMQEHIIQKDAVITFSNAKFITSNLKIIILSGSHPEAAQAQLKRPALLIAGAPTARLQRLLCLLCSAPAAGLGENDRRRRPAENENETPAGVAAPRHRLPIAGQIAGQIAGPIAGQIAGPIAMRFVRRPPLGLQGMRATSRDSVPIFLVAHSGACLLPLPLKIIIFNGRALTFSLKNLFV